MLLKLFLIFLKINLLSPSGPASVAITQKLVVPNMVSEEKFLQIISIVSGVPGSDAVQIAWFVGYEVHGFIGSLVALMAALIPSILLVSFIILGLRLVSPDVLKAFFKGLAPAMATFLVLTATTLLPQPMNIFAFVVILGTILLYFLKVPISVVLLIFGIVGVMMR
jgi:chromate transporter